MSAKYSAAEIFKVYKSFELAPEKIAAIEGAPLDSPALVVAGAGSGKTELLSVRGMYLVANGFARPEEILGLTFTKKAATELARRIFEALIALRDSKYWPEDLEADFSPPTISTYNAFANQIFRDHSLALGYEAEATLLGEAKAFKLAKEVCLAHGAKVSGSLTDLEMNLEPLVEAVLNLSRSLSDNQTSAQQVRSEVEDLTKFLQRLPKKAGAEVSERFGYIEQWIADLNPTPLIAELAERYQSEKRLRSEVDYSDQVALAYRAITEIPDARETIRTRFSQVMLDEYQDTSVLQTKLLSSLFASKAVFAVGDPNQSIYGWRGASSSNLDSFAADFGSAKNFSLATSWRNPKTVLQLANKIAAPLSEQPSYLPKKFDQERVLPVQLIAKPEAIEGEVNFSFSQTILDEAAVVAGFIESSAKSGESSAVLMRKRSNMPIFVEALESRGLEVEVVGLGGLLELPEIVDLVCALKVIQRSDSGSELIRLLSGPRWRIGAKDIDRLHSFARRLAGKREKGSRSEPISIVEALDLTRSEDLKFLEDFSTPTLARLRDAATLFRNLRSATALPLGDFVRTVAEELWLDIELRANPVRSNPLRHLMAFYDRVASFSSASAASQLSAFLSWLDFADGRERFEVPTSKPQAGTVQLLTVHSAKGLEWDAVAIPNLVEDDFPAKPRTSSGWLSLGELPFPLRGDRDSLPMLDMSGVKTQSEANKAKDQFKEANREHLLREENRLIYVAITRSAKRLMLSGSYWKPGNSNPRKPSRYLTELAADFEFPDLESQINPLDLAPKEVSWPLDPLGDAHRTRLTSAGASLQDAIAVAQGKSSTEFSGELHREIDLLLAEQDERIKRLTEIPLPVRIPASKFKDFLQDPQARASQLARPTPAEPYRATATGTAFHSWVEEVLLQQDIEVPASEALAELADIFRNSRFANMSPKEVELEINLTRGANTFVCKLDAVFYDGERYQIVDWKSGKAPKTAEELEAMTFQLALYRFAYSMLRGVAESEIDVLFYFVAENREIQPGQVPTGEELMKLWEEVFS